MEGFIIVTQDQAIRTNAIKARIDKISSDRKCRLCMVNEETIDHLVSSCSKIAQTDYKEWHDKVASIRNIIYQQLTNGGSIKSIGSAKRGR